VPDDPSHIEILDSRDGTGRAAAPALLTGSEHSNIAEFFRQCRFRIHLPNPHKKAVSNQL